MYLGVLGVEENQGTVISVNRAHSEFVLESSDGSLFYFPPCLIAARVFFAGRRMCLQPPIIRQPVGGYDWIHPYVGDLSSRGQFARARLIGKEELGRRPSNEALGYFQGLSRPLCQMCENDICLDGQYAEVALLGKQLGRELTRNDSADLLGIISAIHDIGRRGITLSHQNNHQTPRTGLCAGSMPYPLKRVKRGGQLDRRTFRFTRV